MMRELEPCTAEFMEKIDTWKKDARCNFVSDKDSTSEQVKAVGAIPKKPNSGDSGILSMSPAASSRFLQVTLLVVKAGLL